MEANQITFQGIDSAECERFIKEIRKVARNAGKSRDNNWIIDLVTSGITGPAWRWYVQLEPDIAEDWGKLQGAMIDRWEERSPDDTVNKSRELAGLISTLASPPPLAPPKTENIPAPAPAPAPAQAPIPIPNTIASMYTLSLNETKTGIIRVECRGSDPMYIPSSLTPIYGSKVFTTCNDKSQALLVQITQKCVHHPQEIRIQNSPDHRSFLGIAQEGRGRLGAGSSEQALLVTADWPDSSAGRTTVLRTAVWSICPFDNTIRALWQADGSEFLLQSVLSTATKRIMFVSNVGAYRDANRKAEYPEVKLVFEATS